MRIALLILACFVISSHAGAQAPSVQLQVSNTNLEIGEATDAQLVCTNISVAGAPEWTPPDGLTMQLLSSTPATSSVTSIINGRSTQRTTYTYHLRITATKAGRHVIGPITVPADGATHQSQPVRILVRSPADEVAAPNGDKFLYVELEVQPRSLYLTQPYTATLVIGIRKVEINGTIVDLNLLRDVLDTRSSQLSVFGNGRAEVREQTLADSAGVRHRYQIFEVRQGLRAEQAGQISIGPVFLKANYPTSVARGFFGGYEVTKSRKETARVDAVVIDVKPPPEPGRPADYNGAIGQFQMQVAARPTRVEQGQPVTLAISVSGSPLDGLAGPDLAANQELASRFEYAKEDVVGEMEQGARVFRRAVFPKQQGEQTVPPITWSFFDPHQERYVTLRSDPVSISVDPPSGAPTSITLGDDSAVPVARPSLTAVAGGILPNYADGVLANQSMPITAPWITSLIAAPLTCMVVTVTAKRRGRLAANAALARRRRARRQAETAVARALRQGNLADGLVALSTALTGYLGDRFDLPPGRLTPQEAHRTVASGGHADIAQEIHAFLEACDAVRYVPEGRTSLVPQQAAAEIRDWIRRLEKGRS